MIWRTLIMNNLKKIRLDETGMKSVITSFLTDVKKDNKKVSLREEAFWKSVQSLLLKEEFTDDDENWTQRMDISNIDAPGWSSLNDKSIFASEPENEVGQLTVEPSQKLRQIHGKKTAK